MEEQSSWVLAARKIAEITCPMELALADDVRLRSESKSAQTYTKPKDIYYMICDRLNEGGVTAKRTQCKQMETKPSLPDSTKSACLHAAASAPRCDDPQK